MKFALLIGSNYINVPNSRLYGCINDIINIKNMLIDAYNYNASNIIMLRDDNKNMLPTRNNIINNLTNVINESGKYDELWIHYSGHGSRIIDNNYDENDGYDEVVVPCDYIQEGFITDDIIFNIIKNSKCRTIIVMDCCNSGTVCDLQWTFENNESSFNKYMNPNREIVSNPNVFMISGCKDDQYSNDIYSSENNQSCGALTSTMIKCLRNSQHNIGLFNLYDNICNELIALGFPNQLPVLSSSAENPEHIFQRSVIIKTVVETVVETIEKQNINVTKFDQIHNTLGKNMVSIMLNKAHRDTNKYKPKKKR